MYVYRSFAPTSLGLADENVHVNARVCFYRPFAPTSLRLTDEDVHVNARVFLWAICFDVAGFTG